MREDKCNGEIYAHDYMTNEDWYDFTVAQLRAVTIQYQDFCTLYRKFHQFP